MPRPATRLTGPRDPTAFVVTDREIQLLQLKRRALTPVRQLLVSRRRPAGPLGPTGPSELTPRRPHSEYAGPSAHLEIEISEFSYYRDVLHVEGWAKSEDHLVGLGFVPRAGDVVRVVDLADPSSEEAQSFQFDIYEPDRDAAVNTTLMAEFASGELVAIQEVARRVLLDDPVHVLNRRFQDEIRKLRAPDVLEVGSRARSGNLYRSWLPAGATYVGFDIVPGENVDVVGDVHCLSSSFPAEGFDAIFSVSTMEHLAMPWVAAAEMNRVMRPGGLVFIASNQTWPVHDSPWDFYRFSEDSWATLFNKYSGFEIVTTAAGEPAKVIANIMHAATNGLELQPAFLSSAVLARKVSSTDLVWAAQASEVVSAGYPI